MKTLAERIAEDGLTATSIPLISDGPVQLHGVEVHCPGQRSLRLPDGFPSSEEPTVEQVMRYVLDGCKTVNRERPEEMEISAYLYWVRIDAKLFDLLGSARKWAYLNETEW